MYVIDYSIKRSKEENKTDILQEERAHLAAGQLAEVRFQILSDDGIDGHKAKYTRFSYTALRVIITLQRRKNYNQIKVSLLCF